MNDFEQKFMDDDELTTVQVTKRTSRILAQLAKAYKRSKTSQVEYMAEVEAAKLARVKLLPSGIDAHSVAE